MAERCFRISKRALQHLQTVDLQTLGPKLEALGVRDVQDLELVNDGDLVRWGLTTIERRRFFALVRQVSGERDTGPTSSAVAAADLGVGDTSAASRGGSVHHELPRLAERLLAVTGPLELSELAARLARAAPQLVRGCSAAELPRLVEACVRAYKRLRVEDGLAPEDGPVISICSSVLFSASREVIADTACWVCVCTGLASPGELAVVAALSRASREVAEGPAVWAGLLRRWYPKATLLNPDWVAQSELEKNLEAALEDNYSLAAVTLSLQSDTPLELGTILDALPQRSTPKAILKWMSKHPDHFRQSPDGTRYCVTRRPEDLRSCRDWRMVNPFKLPAASPGGGAGAGSGAGLGVEEPVPAPKPEGWSWESEHLCKELDAKQAFRLYHSGLLMQRSDHSKRGKLEAWEYYTESNSKCVLAPGDLLDLAECRARAVRASDPAVVHELVAQTLEGVASKVPFGFWHRRVRILTLALNDSQLRIGRTQRKKLERKLLEFMEWVKKERGFGFYRCEACGSRWRSGFAYEEMAQECLQCGAFAKPYRIRDLEPQLQGGQPKTGSESLMPGRRSTKAVLLPARSRDRSPEAPARPSLTAHASHGASPLPPRAAATARGEEGRKLRLDAAAAGRFVRRFAERPAEGRGGCGGGAATGSAASRSSAASHAESKPKTLASLEEIGAGGGRESAEEAQVTAPDTSRAGNMASSLGLSLEEAQALGLL